MTDPLLVGFETPGSGVSAIEKGKDAAADCQMPDRRRIVQSQTAAGGEWLILRRAQDEDFGSDKGLWLLPHGEPVEP
jgi:hypothetical protein